MKKLNLQLGSIKEMLTKEQMKKISGGYGECYNGACMDVTVQCICTDGSFFNCIYNDCDCDGLLQCDIVAGPSCFCN